MNRRSLIIGSTAAAFTAPFGRKAWAPPHPKKGVMAVELDGKTYAENQGPLPGISTGTSPVTTIGYLYRGTSAQKPVVGTPQVIIQHTNKGSGSPFKNSFQINHLIQNNNPITQFSMYDSTGNNSTIFWGNNLLYDGFWHSIIFGIESPTSCIIMYDGVSQSVHNTLIGSNQAIDWTYPTRVFGAGLTGNNRNPVYNGYKGSFAELIAFAGGSFIDPSDPTNLAGFWDTPSEEPPRNASDGSGIINGRKPVIYLGGYNFGQNWAAGAFPPGAFAWDDYTPPPNSNFPLVIGSYGVPVDDPWGFTGI